MEAENLTDKTRHLDSPTFDGPDQSRYLELNKNQNSDKSDSATKATQAKRGSARIKDAFQRPYPWLTWLISVSCVGIWLGIQTEGNLNNWDQMARWGYYPYQAVLNGKYWGLISSNFFHQDFFHLFFNLLWVLVLGSKIERTSGQKIFCLLVISSAFISSSSEILVSNQSGIGISGIVYALVGFVLIAGQHNQAYRYYLGRNDYIWLIMWLFGCLIATQSGLVNIANAAHFGGFAWGMCLAAALGRNKWRYPARLGLTVMLGTCFLPFVWMPWSAEWLSYQGLKAYLRKDQAQAKDYLTQAEALDPESVETHLILAKIYADQNKISQAIEQYQKAESIDPNYLAEAQLAQLHFQQNNYPEAFKRARQALNIRPEDPLMNQILVIIEMEQKNWLEAKARLEVLLKAKPADLNYLNLLSQIEMELGNYNLAEKYYQKVLNLDKDNPSALLSQIKLLGKTKQWSLAEQKTLSALKNHPEELSYSIELGYIYLEQNRIDDAIKVYTQVLSRPKINSAYQSNVHYNLACGLMRLNKSEQGLTHLKQAIEIDPSLKANAKTEKDFAAIRQLPAFKKLIEASVSIRSDAY